MTSTIAIVQSSYIPWKGYFDLIRRSDLFVLYDCVQYTANDWRNRNRVKNEHGLHWLTIPVSHGSRAQRICDIQCADRSWPEQHWKTLRHIYAKAPCFLQFADNIEALYQSCAIERADLVQHDQTGLAVETQWHPECRGP